MVKKKMTVSAGVAEVKWWRGVGRYEARQCALALLPILLADLSYNGFVFIAAATPYRCLVPECESTPTTYATPPWWPSSASPRCSRPEFIKQPDSNTSCSADLFANTTSECYQWVYENNDTIISEFNLACQEWKRTMVGTVHNLGVLFSMPLMGFISDKFGRRPAIILGSVSGIIGTFKTLLHGPEIFSGYLAIEFLEALINSGVYTTCFVFMLELMGTDQRILTSFIFGMAILTGDVILSLAAWQLPYWRHLQLLISFPPVIILVYCLFLDESLRWLITTGRMQRATELKEKITAYNGHEVSAKIETSFENNVKEEFSIRLLFSSSVLMKRFASCCYLWFSASLTYYGLMLNSATLPGSRPLNFALGAIMSWPGEVSALLGQHYFGRRATLLTSFVLCGVFCVLNGFVPDSEEWNGARIALVLLGKSSATASFATVYTFTAELLPTSARGSLLGGCSCAARCGSVIAPLTPLLSEWWLPLPTAVFGAVALLAAAITLTVPETRGRPLPDTLEDLH